MIKGLRSLSTQIQLKVNSVIRRETLCVACLASAATSGICQQCLAGLPANLTSCRQCALPLPPAAGSAMLCGECLADPPAFSRTLTPWRYQFPVDHLIGQYKYRRRSALGHPLIREYARFLQRHLTHHPEHRPDLLIPSPMSGHKQRRRGFNQAADIAEQLSRTLGIPWSDTVVQRNRSARSQSGLSRAERLTNLRGIYRVDGAVPARVAIVDDVMTTGATARVLSLALRDAGARDIQAWPLARTPGPGQLIR